MNNTGVSNNIVVINVLFLEWNFIDTVLINSKGFCFEVWTVIYCWSLVHKKANNYALFMLYGQLLRTKC